MSSKTPVSTLEEFCAKYQFGRPEYKYSDCEDGSYTCIVKLHETVAYGNARNKRESKHVAASNLMRKVMQNSDLQKICDISDKELTTYDSMDKPDDVKNPISALQEYCAKAGIFKPDYSFRSSDDTGFICTVSVLNMKAIGNGRNKRDAKLMASVNITRKIHSLPKKPEKLPLPTVEIIEEKRIINTPVIGKSQKASDILKNFEYEIPNIELDMERISVNNIMDDIQSRKKNIFNIYRNITNSGPFDCKKVLLCDRHNYFKSFPYSKKSVALDILKPSNDAKYNNQKDRALSVISALGITSRITNLSLTILEEMIQIELVCEYDCVFIGFEREIYGQVLQYFREMLI